MGTVKKSTATMTSQWLAFGTLVRVVNLENQKSIDVRINDRGPFVDDRVIDLSHAAARAIDLIGPGTARVRLEVLLQNRANAERLRAEMEARYGAARLVLRPGDPPLWRVMVGHAATLDEAGVLASRIHAEHDGTLGQAFVVRDDAAETLAKTTSF